MDAADLKEIFLAFVRLGIGNDTSLPTGEIDWEAIEALAERHGLLGVIVDGVQRLPKNMRPPQLMLCGYR